jgi:sigma-B regulation protein RsbU (phosphoserine phosphatase)
MTEKCTVSPTILVKGTAAINILGNLFGMVLTFIYFAILEPLLHTGIPVSGLWRRSLLFASVVTIVVVGVIAPINTRWVLPLAREVRKVLSPNGQEASMSDLAQMRLLAGKLVNLPMKLAVTTLAGWLIAAILFSILPHVFPNLHPWPHESSHKISAWMVFVAAPITVSWVYFVQERWLRMKMPVLFPGEALVSVPPAFRINVLTKLLIVTLVITCIPLTMISHVTLHQIHEIKAGNQSVDAFLAHMPTLIWFLFGVSVTLAAGLSVFIAKSVSEPLSKFESAMRTVRHGNLDVTVPVLTNDEIGRTGEGFNRMIKVHRELDSIRDTFGRYLSEDVVEEILKSPGGVELRGELRDITILVADLRGFTRITASLEPRQVLDLINRYLEKMTEIIMKHGGTIDEFTGDGILVFFGAPKTMPEHCLTAVKCSLEMQEAMDALNAENLQCGLPALEMGIGVNTGQLIVGNIGSEKRKKYGAVGSPINLAFRIEAETAGKEILVAPAVLPHLDGKGVVVKASEEALLKGMDLPVTLYRVQRGSGTC